MTKTDIGKILAIIPKTGNTDFDEHINQAKIAIAAAPDMPDHIESQPESQILESCIELMQDLTDSFLEWYDFVYGEDAMKNMDIEVSNKPISLYRRLAAYLQAVSCPMMKWMAL